MECHGHYWDNSSLDQKSKQTFFNGSGLPQTPQWYNNIFLIGVKVIAKNDFLAALLCIITIFFSYD